MTRKFRGFLTSWRTHVAVGAAGLTAIALAAPAEAALPVGAGAPDFTTQAAIGGKRFTFVLSDALSKGPVVLYFFPAAFTPGCTIEAHSFAQSVKQFQAAGATVIGVAADPIETLQRFSVEACRNAFPVAVATPVMISGYDVALPTGGRSNRTSFVIAKTGKIAYVYSAPAPQAHITNTLTAVKALR